MIRIGILREGKVPPDKRVPLTPAQCKEVEESFAKVEIVVQPSPIRSFKDEEYSNLGLRMSEDLSECDILLGVKEVNTEDLIPGKTFMFFSHTYKEQPYNRGLLQAILEKNIRLVDYEMLTRPDGRRVIGFGRYAGIVGCYNGLLAYGKKHGIYDLKPAHLCADRREMESELAKVKLPADTRIVLTGKGRVGHGALEVLNKVDIRETTPEEIRSEQSLPDAVYSVLDTDDYYTRPDGAPIDKSQHFEDPDGAVSILPEFLPYMDLYIACHYWDSRAAFLLTRDDLAQAGRRLSVVADISCDIDGPVACTLRPSTIADPLYGYDPREEKEGDFMSDDTIGVMAVDNLPCELPKDASEDFGKELIAEVLPYLLENDDADGRIERASETSLEGELMPSYAYLQDYVEGK